MTPLRAAWESLRERWLGSFEEFEASVADYEVHAVTVDGETVGAILVKGPEIHACIRCGFGRWFRRPQAAVLNAVIEKHGYAQTHATTEAGKQFVLRLGFEPYGTAFRRYTLWGSK